MSTEMTKKKSSTKSSKETISIHLGCVTTWKSLDECTYLLEGLKACCQMGYKMFFLAQGELKTIEALAQIQKQYPAHLDILEDNDKNREWILRHSHVLLIPHAPTKSELKTAQTNKLIPLTVDNKYLENFYPSKEKGEAFLFKSGDQWDFIRSVVRAAENKQFGYDWGNLKRALGKVNL